MSLETGNYVANLVATNPLAADPKSQGDDHLRLLKSVLLNTFAGFPGMVIVTGTEAQGATASDYTVTVSPAPAAYTASMMVVLKATHANIGAATVQVNALGAKALLDIEGNAVVSGYIALGAMVIAYYDGTNFYCVSATGIKPFLLGQLANYAPLASPALTGTPTAPTPAAGDMSTKLATTQFVLSVAYGAVTLPILQGETRTTDSQSLMATACYRSEYITAAANSMFMLPDARSLNVGFCYEINSVNAVQLMKNDGKYIGSSNVPAGLSRLWLLDNSTQGGIWAVSAAAVMTTLNSVALNTSAVVTSSMPSLNPQAIAITLDATRTLVLYSNTANASAASGIYAVVITCAYTGIGRPVISVGTPLLVSGGANVGTPTAANLMAAVSVGTELTALTWCEQVAGPSATPRVVILQTSGATVTAGAISNLHAAFAGTYAAYTNPAPTVAICSPATGSFVVAYQDGSSATYYARAGTNSGTTITLGAEYTIQAMGIGGNYVAGIACCALSSGLVAFNTFNTNRSYVTAATVSGTVLSPGAPVLATAGQTYPTGGMSRLSATSGLAVSSGEATVFTVSGNTVTMGTPTALANGPYCTAVLSASSFWVYEYGGLAVNYTISGTTISAGSPASFSASTGFGDFVYFKQPPLLNGTKVIAGGSIATVSSVTQAGSVGVGTSFCSAITGSGNYVFGAASNGSSTTLTVYADIAAAAIN